MMDWDDGSGWWVTMCAVMFLGWALVAAVVYLAVRDAGRGRDR